jgi:ATP-dependent helicase/nuclease subunit B
MPLDRLHIPADARFWPAAARAVADFAMRHGAPERQLQSVTWLVPGGQHAELARAALRSELGGRAFMPPRIVPLTAWLGHPMATGTAAQVELFTALRANRWVREAFGAQSATLWALARDVAHLCDELTLASVGGAEDFDGRLQTSLRRHFHRRASHALQAQSQLVIQLWHARRQADDGAARFLRELAARASRAPLPLVYLGTGLSAAGRAGLATWERAFIDRAAEQAPVLLLDPDVTAALEDQPLLAAAWPELGGADTDMAIAARADAVRAAPRPSTPLSIVKALTLEEEAIAVAQQVVEWRRAGVGSIALVALDRLTARRVRALLERAQVSVRDETGWKLSTTSAAAAIMRWHDVVADDLYWRDLLDWLKSNFTLSGRPDKSHEVDRIERSIRAAGALQGAKSIRRALANHGSGEAREHGAGALEVIALVESQAQATRRSAPTLLSHLQALRQAMDALGMRAALAADPVGQAVLIELAALEAELATLGGRASLADFRALLASRFEEVAFVDRRIESPVVMVSLASAALRSFDAAVLVGADAQHLPSRPSEVLFMSNAVRAELGLTTADSAVLGQAAQLATLLATSTQVVATWRICRGDDPSPLSPLLDRLRFIAQRVLGDDLTRLAVPESVEVEAVVTTRPAPRASQLLPARISASQAQSLVDCPYQFYARRMLGLRAPDDVIELPEKREFGIALHEVLSRFHKAWGAVDFSAVAPVELVASLREHARAVFGPQIERTPGLLAFERRFDGLVDGYIDWLQQHAGNGWLWTGGEVNHRRTIVLNAGREVELIGRVDRVDTQADGRLRVLDYKARAADVLRRGVKSPGEDIQLPFYGLLLPRRPGSGEYVSFDRVREDTSGVKSVAPTGAFNELIDVVEARLTVDLQRMADGVAMPAIGAESVCVNCEMRGLCRRDYWKHGGESGDPDSGDPFA